MVGVAFPDDLTDPERLLCEALPRGAWVDLREGDPAADDLGHAPSWGPGREIRAEVIRALLLGAGIGRGSPGTEAVAAYGLAVDGGVECIELTAHGTVAMRVARITGSLDLTGARISCPGGRGFAADYAEIGGRLDCRGMVVEG